MERAAWASLTMPVYITAAVMVQELASLLVTLYAGRPAVCRWAP